MVPTASPRPVGDDDLGAAVSCPRVAGEAAGLCGGGHESAVGFVGVRVVEVVMGNMGVSGIHYRSRRGFGVHRWGWPVNPDGRVVQVSSAVVIVRAWRITRSAVTRIGSVSPVIVVDQLAI